MVQSGSRSAVGRAPNLGGLGGRTPPLAIRAQESQGRVYGKPKETISTEPQESNEIPARARAEAPGAGGATPPYLNRAQESQTEPAGVTEATTGRVERP